MRAIAQAVRSATDTLLVKDRMTEAAARRGMPARHQTPK
jgi:hypothetical protein